MLHPHVRGFAARLCWPGCCLQRERVNRQDRRYSPGRISPASLILPCDRSHRRPCDSCLPSAKGHIDDPVTVVFHPRRATDRACECLHPQRVTAHAVSHLLGDLLLTDSSQSHKPSRGQATPVPRAGVSVCGSNLHRHRRHRQRGPPTRSAKLFRQLTPPSCSAKQRAPTASDHVARSAPCRSSHRSVPISRGSTPNRHRRRPPTRSAKQVRQLTPPSCSASQRAPTGERQLPVMTSPDR
jgi:hypothetical protein